MLAMACEVGLGSQTDGGVLSDIGRVDGSVGQGPGAFQVTGNPVHACSEDRVMENTIPQLGGAGGAIGGFRRPPAALGSVPTAATRDAAP